MSPQSFYYCSTTTSIVQSTLVYLLQHHQHCRLSVMKVFVLFSVRKFISFKSITRSSYLSVEHCHVGSPWQLKREECGQSWGAKSNFTWLPVAWHVESDVLDFKGGKLSLGFWNLSRSRVQPRPWGTGRGPPVGCNRLSASNGPHLQRTDLIFEFLQIFVSRSLNWINYAKQRIRKGVLRTAHVLCM